MAKIPRLPRQDTPSSVVGGAPQINTGLAGAVTGALGKAAGVGYNIAADSEAAHAKTLREAMAAKQAIVDEVDATRRSADFNEFSVSLQADLQQRYADAPDKAIQPYIEAMRKHADEQITAAPNTDVGMHLARTTASHISAGTNDMHQWATRQQTQKTKANIEELANKYSAGGKRSPDFVAYLASADAVKPLLVRALGPVDAEKRLHKMRADATYEFYDFNGERNGPAVMADLDSDDVETPANKYLTGDQRAALRQKTKAAVRGLAETQKWDVLTSMAGKYRDTYAQLVDGKFDSETELKMLRANEERRKAVAVDGRIDDESRAMQIRDLEDEKKFVETMGLIRRQGLQYSGEDDEGTVAALLQEHQDLLGKKKKSRDLKAVLAHQDHIAAAILDKKISRGTADRMFKSVALDLPKAGEAESGNTGWNVWVLGSYGDFRNARQVGNSELEGRFGSALFKGVSPRQKNATYIEYMNAMNRSEESGKTPTANEARLMALEALSRETGIKIPGIYGNR